MTLTLYPSLERMYFKCSYIYIEPELPKIYSVRNFCKYLHHHYVEKKSAVSFVDWTIGKYMIVCLYEDLAQARMNVPVR